MFAQERKTPEQDENENVGIEQTVEELVPFLPQIFPQPDQD